MEAADAAKIGHLGLRFSVGQAVLGEVLHADAPQHLAQPLAHSTHSKISSLLARSVRYAANCGRP